MQLSNNLILESTLNQQELPLVVDNNLNVQEDLSYWIDTISYFNDQINALCFETKTPECPILFLNRANEIINKNIETEKKKECLTDLITEINYTIANLKVLRDTQKKLTEKDQIISLKQEETEEYEVIMSEMEHSLRKLDFGRNFGNALKLKNVYSKPKEIEDALKTGMLLVKKYLQADNFSLRTYDRDNAKFEPIANDDYENHETIILEEVGKNAQTALGEFLQGCADSKCLDDVTRKKPHFFEEKDKFTAIFPMYDGSGRLYSIATFYFDNQSNINDIKINCQNIYKLFAENSDKFQTALELQNMALVDGLTDIGNRRAFNEEIRQIMNQRKEKKLNNIEDAEEKPFSIAMIDIDFFKKVNDTYGHNDGDIVLKKLGEILKNNIRNESDRPFRYGGEEFIITFPNTDLKSAALIAERIRQEIENTEIEISNNRKIKITASFGVVEYSEECINKWKETKEMEKQKKNSNKTACANNNETDILKDLADQGLYEAKQVGRNRVIMVNQDGMLGIRPSKKNKNHL